MQGLSPRQTEIVKLARSAGRVVVDDLVVRFDVTPQTIRKDLNDLCDLGVLQRFHGGAMFAGGVANLGYENRRNISSEAKHLIGERAAQLIPDNCSVFLNIGTTTEEVARALHGHHGLMVITNNLNVAQLLRGQAHNEVIVAGGVLRHADGGIVGEAAVEFIRQFKVDFAVMGVSAIDTDGSLLDFDFREVSVSRAIMATSRRSILVADAMKFSRSAPVRIGHITDVDLLVTDKPLDDELARICAEGNVVVEVADGGGTEA
ncbi:MAG: DeoR/GlpR transcriptional regulator [Chromatiaceae bacterium]|nr:DeoR/GlpR transcriptional regulator [Gammaproteobacteria bacterium]MCP5298225.1 DeoR/GlpR transcriptional regulator [Chromatiaceae bacterium]MCP5423235.1 DeoR/GlpR transcriptional regulator [Chromatiaceae bacterium]